ncbi:MAG: gluconate 2-dehydrogenase subunit 3 family protein [Bacteroidota bacterium]
MKRREAIKGLGGSLGILFLTPTVFVLLESCAEEKVNWVPSFFSEEQALFLNRIADVILPKTEDSPSATEVNVPQFIDKFASEVLELKEQDVLKKGVSNFGNLVMKAANTEVLDDLKPKDIEPVFGRILKKTKEENETIMKSFNEAIENETPLSEETTTYVALHAIRRLCIFAYRNSEVVGEDIMAYKPVPTKQEGCIDIDETNGKAYALPLRKFRF